VTVYVYVLDYCYANKSVSYTANSRQRNKAAPDNPKSVSDYISFWIKTAREVLAIKDTDFVLLARY